MLCLSYTLLLYIYVHLLVPLPYVIAENTVMNYLQQGTLVRCQLDIAVLPLHCTTLITDSLILCLNIYDQVFVLRPSCVPKKGGGGT